ncbi:hypothetical protein [Legionella israelensis]|uniref:Uncharacterized protein n=2 Tax=Legionella israelensis TaxID=454 RepID=A0A0W0WNK0_9GAMM|nr:hypothetical protein [Legionella israelensis]KTD33902.1 hypothetical protein Lisr_0270 [Legionella israelensis]QBS08931.1 hypothetical protein E4T55_03095 [Legionella israelensis]SCX82231.1 hypothetical protein SAMN02746069_00341 [Legionella israelensis DSM 19235]STX58622.1 Uncharacterised protein [Legionella israelensis]
MFNELYDYFLTQRTELAKMVEAKSENGLKQAIFNALDDFKQEASEHLYHESVLIEKQINYLILQELYCRQIEKKNEEGTVRAWLKLEDSYKKLEHMLIQARMQDFKNLSAEEKSDKIKEEINFADQHIRENSSANEDFLKMMVFVRKEHNTVAKNEADVAVSYFSSKHEELSKKSEALQTSLETLKGEKSKLKDEQEKQVPLSMLEQWAVKVKYDQANLFQRFIVWAVNKFSNLGEKAPKRFDELRKTQLALNMKTGQVSNTETLLMENNREKRHVAAELTSAKKRKESAELFYEKESSHDKSSEHTSEPSEQPINKGF